MSKALKVQVVERALDILSDRRRWSRRYIAYQATLNPKRYCWVGALIQATEDVVGTFDRQLYEGIKKEISGKNGSWAALDWLCIVCEAGWWTRTEVGTAEGVRTYLEQLTWQN